MNPSRLLDGIEAFRDSKVWNEWALKTLFALGVGHVLAGIIFFFAHNWFAFPDMAKFGVIGAGIGLSVLIWLVLKLDGVVAQAFGIAATVLVGVVFAVFGQVYQTPALIHTPFVLWALMTLPFAAVSKNLAHYTVWIIIALVAVFAYAETGFYIAGKPILADALIYLIALLAFIALVCLDRILRPKFEWARGHWFRLFLIAVCGGLLLSAFTSSFWPWRMAEDIAISYLLSFLVFITAAGLVGYLYKFKPSLAGLTLGSVAVAAMIVQIVIKLFQNSEWGVEIFLFVFLIFSGLTALLAIALKHFANITRTEEQAVQSKGLSQVTVSASFIANAVKCPEQDVIEAAVTLEANESPWYIETFIAFAAIVTAGFGVGFFGLMFAAMFNDEMTGVALCVLGVPFYGAAIVSRTKSPNGYPRHLFNTLIMIGAAMIVGGLVIAFESKIEFLEEILVAIVFCLSVINLYFVRDKIIEFLSVFIALNIIYLYFSQEMNFPYVEVLLAAGAIFLGVIFLTLTIGKRYYSAAGFALLLYAALLATYTNNRDKVMSLLQDGAEHVFSPLMLVKPAIGVFIAAAAIIYLNKTGVFKGWRPPLAALIPILFILVLFPFGGAFAFLLIVTGFILGNRILALFGVLFQIYYLYMFYYELSISLGIKSYILFAVGIVLIAVWMAARKRYQGSVTP